MTMMVCSKLGKTEDEIGHFTIADIVRWSAFFRLMNEQEAREIANAKSGGRGGGGIPGPASEAVFARAGVQTVRDDGVD